MTGKEHIVGINRLDTWMGLVPELLELWNRNYVSRRHLRDLDDAQLRDIGLDRVSANLEAKKPFWRR